MGSVFLILLIIFTALLLGLFTPFYYDDELATWLMLGEVGKHLREGAAHAFFVHLGYLAAGGATAVGTEGFAKLTECLDHSVGRLVEDHRAGLFCQSSKACGTPLLLWQKALESEPFAREPRRYESGHEGRGTGQALHRDATSHASSHEHKSWIGYAGGASIGDERHHLASCHAGGKGFGGLVLVEFVVRHELILDIEVLQEDARGAGIFCQYEVGFLEYPQCAERDIFEIADGCRHQIQCSHGANIELFCGRTNKKRGFSDFFR